MLMPSLTPHEDDIEPVALVSCGALQRLRAAANRLLEAWSFANAHQRDVWDFAVSRSELRQLQAADTDLRWLVCLGYAEQAIEIFEPPAASRLFNPNSRNSLVLTKHTCFVLTRQGAELLHGLTALAEESDLQFPSPTCALSTCACSQRPQEVPEWDAHRQELRLLGHVVKRFKVPAPNQEMILSSFQEEGWPVHIDDPLPPHPNLDPKQRLHDTINSLNRSQRKSLIHFSGNGKGSGIRWEARAEDVVDALRRRAK